MINHDSIARYRGLTRKSERLFKMASDIMPGGQSHNARFFEPYPFYAWKAKGKYIWDVDQNRYTDFWMGHTALVLGHSPSVVSRAINLQSHRGLLFGSPNKFAFQLAELVTQTVPCAQSVRFCTSGAEATMYAIRLARAFTRKRIIVKMAGGWHGYNSALSVGVSEPYDLPESRGLIPQEGQFLRLARFNSEAETVKVLDENSQDLAAIIVEPVMGAGGTIPARREYLRFLSEECRKRECLLIFDEIITGFRLALGGAQEFYGVTPDLVTLGKILGGGLPVSAVAGRKEILDLADTTSKKKTERCWIGGGTFSENALCMQAGLATLRYLIANEGKVYSKINNLGNAARKSIDEAFGDQGIRTKTIGEGSLFVTHFLSPGQEEILTPDDVNASNRSLQRAYYFSLIAKNKIYFIPGHVGAISSAHDETDVSRLVDASESFARGSSAISTSLRGNRKSG